MGRQRDKIATTSRSAWFRAGPQIFLVIPEPHYEDTPEAARENARMMVALSQEVGKPCGFVVVMSNHISQDAESRKAYADIVSPDVVCGTALVAENALSRAISSFFTGIAKPRVPLKVVGSIEEGIAWLEGLLPR